MKLRSRISGSKN